MKVVFVMLSIPSYCVNTSLYAETCHKIVEYTERWSFRTECLETKSRGMVKYCCESCVNIS